MSAGANPKITIDQLLLRSIYYRYQSFVVPGVVIAVCVLLFWFVVMPQIQSWFAMKDALAQDTQSVGVMQQNLTLMTKLDSATLNQTLTTATIALPTDKDFSDIITALQNAAAVAGTSLGDYAFQLGDLSGLDQNGKATQLPLQLNVTIKGNITDAQRFVSQLARELPLSDTIAIALGDNGSITATVDFYYASLPKIVFQDDAPLPSISSADQKLLQTLFTNNNIGTTTLASESAAVAPSVSPTPTVTPTLIPTATPTAVASSSAQ